MSPPSVLKSQRMAAANKRALDAMVKRNEIDPNTGTGMEETGEGSAEMPEGPISSDGEIALPDPVLLDEDTQFLLLWNIRFFFLDPFCD